MTTRNRTPKTGASPSGSGKRRRSGNSGPIAFFVALFIMGVGAIQLASTFNTYAADLAHLNSLRREEASLIERKHELENDISRWDDKNYVAAQARDRLGFVFPGETAVRVLNPQAVTGETGDGADSSGDGATDASKQLPWYSELSYAFGKADEPLPANSAGDQATDGSDQSGRTVPQQDADSDGTSTKKDQQ